MSYHEPSDNEYKTSMEKLRVPESSLPHEGVHYDNNRYKSCHATQQSRLQRCVTLQNAESRLCVVNHDKKSVRVFKPPIYLEIILITYYQNDDKNHVSFKNSFSQNTTKHFDKNEIEVSLNTERYYSCRFSLSSLERKKSTFL